jgi:hypothetical protein
MEQGKEKIVYHCFFEQSGTFKNEFRKLGYMAYDYDILNDFNQTDFIIDLFKEIEKAYNGESSLFDTILPNHYIIAFFPCIRFENQILLSFRGEQRSLKNWSIEKKLEYDMKLQDEVNVYYKLISKFVIVCLRKNIQLVIENPYSTQHYLTKYWCLKPSIIDSNRRDWGDYFEKPTQYWFINCKPKENFIFESLPKPSKKLERNCNTVERSMISPTYANRFIREYLIDLNQEEL